MSLLYREFFLLHFSPILSAYLLFSQRCLLREDAANACRKKDRGAVTEAVSVGAQLSPCAARLIRGPRFPLVAGE